MTLSKLLNLSVPQFFPLSNGIKSENKGFEGWSEQCPARCKFLISVSFICISLVAKHCLRGCHCSVTKSCLTLRSHGLQRASFPVLHYFLEFAQIHVHWLDDAIQPSHLLPPFSFSLQTFPTSGSLQSPKCPGFRTKLTSYPQSSFPSPLLSSFLPSPSNSAFHPLLSLPVWILQRGVSNKAKWKAPRLRIERLTSHSWTMLTVANGTAQGRGQQQGQQRDWLGRQPIYKHLAPCLSPSSRASAAIVRWAQPPGPHKGSGYTELAPETSRGVSLLQLDQGEAGGVWGRGGGDKDGSVETDNS